MHEVALRAARDLILFRLEMGGWAPDDVITVVRQIDAALGEPPTPLERCPSDEP